MVAPLLSTNFKPTAVSMLQNRKGGHAGIVHWNVCGIIRLVSKLVQYNCIKIHHGYRPKMLEPKG